MSPRLQAILEKVDRLPLSAGVYLMKDKKGRVLYVGKAQRLRTRVKQYFNGSDTRAFIPLLERLLADIETVVVRNDKEAMLLENTLIKQHKPRFNVKLRDDKQYLLLRLDPKAAWPRLEVVRRRKRDGAQYFGPYHHASSARQTLRVVNRHFQLRTCTDFALRTRKRACLQYQIGRCPAPCVYEVDREEYGASVRDVGMFLGGRQRELVDEMQARMKEHAKALEFEQAARVRDQLHAVEKSLERQEVVGSSPRDQDVIGYYREGGQVELVILHLRRGQLTGSQAFSQRGMELPDQDLVAGFLSAYYAERDWLPHEILIPVEIAKDDADPLLALLSERASRAVKLRVAQRGEGRRLVELAGANAKANFRTRRDRESDAMESLRRLQKALNLAKLPRRIECFDISHVQGSDPVASMVVFQDGEAETKSYRSFKIRGGQAQQNDDFASMYETLLRRLRRSLKEEAWALPDLMVIDGGKGQLGRVLAALDDLGIAQGAEGVEVVSLAKERNRWSEARELIDQHAAGQAEASSGEPSHPSTPGAAYAEALIKDAKEASSAKAADAGSEKDTKRGKDKPERVFLPGRKDSLRLAPGSSELYLMMRVRDEAHRFAITHHRKRRSKRALDSQLDAIEGVGPALRRSLVEHFGSFRALREAEPEALLEVRGVGPKLAQRLHEALRG